MTTPAHAAPIAFTAADLASINPVTASKAVPGNEDNGTGNGKGKGNGSDAVPTATLTPLPVTTLPGTTLPGTTLPGTTLPGTTLPGTTLPGTTPPAVTLPVTASSVTPVAPDAPGMSAASAGDGSAVVRWTAPASDGGSAIYGYEVQALDPETGIVVGVDATGPDAAEITMTGLTNGVPYAFWVRAVNAAGAGMSSDISNVVVPAAVPTGTNVPPTTPAPTGTTPAPAPTTPAPLATTPTPTPTTSTPKPVPSTSTPKPVPSTSTPKPVPSTSTPRAVPAIPASLTAQPGPAGGNLTTVLRWTPGSANGAAVTGFRLTVQRLAANGEATGAPTVIVLAGNARTTTFTAPSGARAGTSYRYSVQQVNAVGVGSSRTVNGYVR